MRGGGSKAVWNFSENSSILVGPSVPKGKHMQHTFFIGTGRL